MDNQHDIFISYSRKDTTVVNKIRTAVKRLGYTVWLDQEALPGSPQWYADIANAIKNAGMLLFYRTENSVQSEWCARELMMADDEGISIVPVVNAGFRSHLPDDPRVSILLVGRQNVFIEESSDVAMICEAISSSLARNLGEGSADKSDDMELFANILDNAVGIINVNNKEEPLVETWRDDKTGGLRLRPRFGNLYADLSMAYPFKGQEPKIMGSVTFPGFPTNQESPLLEPFQNLINNACKEKGIKFSRDEQAKRSRLVFEKKLDAVSSEGQTQEKSLAKRYLQIGKEFVPFSFGFFSTIREKMLPAINRQNKLREFAEALKAAGAVEIPAKGNIGFRLKLDLSKCEKRLCCPPKEMDDISKETHFFTPDEERGADILFVDLASEFPGFEEGKDTDFKIEVSVYCMGEFYHHQFKLTEFVDWAGMQKKPNGQEKRSKQGERANLEGDNSIVASLLEFLAERVGSEEAWKQWKEDWEKQQKNTEQAGKKPKDCYREFLSKKVVSGPGWEKSERDKYELAIRKEIKDFMPSKAENRVTNESFNANSGSNGIANDVWGGNFTQGNGGFFFTLTGPLCDLEDNRNLLHVRIQIEFVRRNKTCKVSRAIYHPSYPEKVIEDDWGTGFNVNEKILPLPNKEAGKELIKLDELHVFLNQTKELLQELNMNGKSKGKTLIANVKFNMASYGRHKEKNIAWYLKSCSKSRYCLKVGQREFFSDSTTATNKSYQLWIQHFNHRVCRELTQIPFTLFVAFDAPGLGACRIGWDTGVKFQSTFSLALKHLFWHLLYPQLKFTSTRHEQKKDKKQEEDFNKWYISSDGNSIFYYCKIDYDDKEWKGIYDVLNTLTVEEIITGEALDKGRLCRLWKLLSEVRGEEEYSQLTWLPFATNTGTETLDRMASPGRAVLEAGAEDPVEVLDEQEHESVITDGKAKASEDFGETTAE